MNMRLAARSVAVTLAFVLWSTRAFAQSTTDSVSGVITDPSGAVLPGVDIVVTQTDTGLLRELVSDSSGHYRVLNLYPGPYRVVAGLAGFRVGTVEGLMVTISRDVHVDIELQLAVLD